MCSIFGILGVEGDRGKSLIENMTLLQWHRGPDGKGAYSDGLTHLGMTRLSIIGFKDGEQPLYNETKDIVLVCNGEIYNDLELRQRLEGLDHRFTTSSDCETIIHGYEQWGLDVLHKLRGMYAFCLYDKRLGKVYLVRDRIGEKPLYYTNKEALIFASEAKALIGSGSADTELSMPSVHQFFLFNYISEPNTVFKDIQKLSAGHYLEWNAKTKNFQIQEYWSLTGKHTTSYDSLEEVLEDIGRHVFRSERPIGVALSGGLDSSLVAALARKNHTGELFGFSVGYPGRPEVDERSDAQQLANHLGLNLVETEVSVEDFIKDFGQVIFANDDPICDISSVNYFRISQLAKEKGVPVLFQGHGGDELFWGYDWVQKSVGNNINRQAAVAQYLGINWLPLRKNIFQYIRQIISQNKGRAKRKELLNINPQMPFFYNMRPDFQYTFFNAKKLFGVVDRREILKEANVWGLDPDDIEVDLTASIIRTYLLENGIAQGDRLSMFHSVELRLPLVDAKLIEFVIAQRRQGFLRGDWQLAPKHHLRVAAANYLPSWVLTRKKRGFTPPYDLWLKRLFQEKTQVLRDGGCVVMMCLK